MKLCFVVNHRVNRRKEVFKGTATPWGYSVSFQHCTVVKNPVNSCQLARFAERTSTKCSANSRIPLLPAPDIQPIFRGHWKYFQVPPLSWSSFTNGSRFCHREFQIVINPFAVAVWKQAKKKRKPLHYQEETPIPCLSMGKKASDYPESTMRLRKGTGETL